MKIGVITIFNVENYGAELQAFATVNSLNEMGYEAELIDYPFYKNKRHILTKGSKSLFPIPFKRRLAEFLSPKINAIRNSLINRKEASLRSEAFKLFHMSNTPISREYRTIESLYSTNMGYDVYIVGSDQVWNPYNYTSLDPYFLKFAPNNKIKIAYASSFGVSSLPDYTREYYKNALSGLDAIGVREENAVNIIKEIAGLQAEWVLDPTLLIKGEKWDNYSNVIKDIPERYILIYEPSICPYVKTLAQHIATIKGIKIVRLGMDTTSDNDIIDIVTAGPAEFLWLIRNADFVVTNSFHGTAFSINMNKDFYTVNLGRRHNASRQKSLLKLVGLEDRQLEEDAPLPDSNSLQIDFTNPNKLLELARNKSIQFLKNAINGE